MPISRLTSRASSPGAAVNGRSALYLFTRDLRLQDHAGLAAASLLGPVVPALVMDPATVARVGRSPGRAAFYCGAVGSLARSLEAAGTTLAVRRGSLVRTVRRLAREAGARAVVWSASYDAAGAEQDSSLRSSLEEAGLRAVIVHDAPVVEPEETAETRASEAGLGYRSLAAYEAMWRRATPAPVTLAPSFLVGGLPSEPLPQPHEFCPGSGETAAPDAGEAAAQARLAAFVDGPLLRYAAGRFAAAEDGTSRLGPHLSFGTLGARTIAARLRDRAADPYLLAEERVSMDSFARSLARRDFFLQLGWFFGEPRDEPLVVHMRGFPFARRHAHLAAWQEGRTGFALVDAGMRELRATGWMHPQVRPVAASFLCFDLGVDWRVGREHWDSLLIEDDPALATGNWQWIAGVGADLAQYPRIYNPEAQTRRLDPLGTYVRRWVPELQGARLSGDARQPALPLFGGQTYPPPVLDHGAAARDFLARYKRFMEPRSRAVPALD